MDLARCIMQEALDLGLLTTPLDIQTNAILYSQCFDDSWDRVPDTTRARDILGFESQVPVREGLRKTLWRYRDIFARPHKEPASTYAASKTPPTTRSLSN